MALKINIHDIRHQKAAQIRDTLVIDAGDLDLPDLPGVAWKPLTFAYVMTNAGQLFVLQGKVEGDLALECSRCLTPVLYPLEVDVLEQFSRNPQEDEDIHMFFGEEIDIAGALRDCILLNLPVKPLCSPNCLGLCSHCGTDLNQESCNCNPRDVDPRLAVLEKLIRK